MKAGAATIDSGTYGIVTILETGYAVQLSCLSASGPYLFTIGRDAKINLLDLWMEMPATVAGSYWPPQDVIMDGDTLGYQRTVYRQAGQSLRFLVLTKVKDHPSGCCAQRVSIISYRRVKCHALSQ